MQIGFMTPGHTHEDIDALFGVLARLLQNRDALTIPDMTEAWEYIIARRAEAQSTDEDVDDSEVETPLAATQSVMLTAIPNFAELYAPQVQLLCMMPQLSIPVRSKCTLLNHE